MKYIQQFAIIFLISMLAELLERLMPFPVSASVYGLIIMLIALMTHIIPLSKVERAADILIEIMPILFVPSAVSVMTNFELLQTLLLPILTICIVTTLIVMIITGRIAQKLMDKTKK